VHGVLQGAGEDPIGDLEKADDAGKSWPCIQRIGYFDAIFRLEILFS